MLRTCIIAFLVVGCGSQDHEVPGNEASKGRVVDEQAEAPTYSTRSSQQAGDVSLPVPIDDVWKEVPATSATPPLFTEVVEDGITWRYMGQHRSLIEPQVVEFPQVVPYVLGPEPQSIDEAVLGTSRLNSRGEEWLSVDLTPEKRAELEELDASVDKGDPVDLPIDEPLGDIILHSWYTQLCPAIPLKGAAVAYPGSDHEIWDPKDNRYPLLNDADYSKRKRAVVAIYTRPDCATNWLTHPTDYACSGVLVDDDTILTSGHCLSAHVGGNVWTKRDTCEFRVCTLGNFATATVNGVGVDAECFIPEEFDLPATWTNNGYTNHDVGLVHLDAGLPNPATPGADLDQMLLASSGSGATTAVLHSGSFSPWHNDPSDPNGQGCANNIEEPSFSVGDTNLSNMRLVKQAGSVVVVHANGIMQNTFDGGPGFSGSPIWWCPGGGSTTCGGGDQASVLAVWSGWSSTNLNHTAVSVPARHAWISSNL